MIDVFLEAGWQFAVLAAVASLACFYQKQRPSMHALLSIVFFGLSIFFFNVWVFSDDLDYAYKLYNAGINAQLVVYLGEVLLLIFWPVDKEDLPGKLLWVCVFTAEAWGLLFNNIGCNLILETASRAEVAEVWGTEASKYVCGREIGEWFEFAPLLVEIGFMTWIVQRWRHAREELGEC